MAKFSDFIRNLGTAGPSTLQGIYALGFALRSEWPGVLAKYLRVDAAQTFTASEQLQGRDNLGLGTISTQDAGAVAITGGTISDLTSPLAVADGGTGGATAAAARTGIELGNVDNTSDLNKPISTATQTALDLKAPLASPALTGVPTAPTAAPGTNTTQVATTAFVATSIVFTGFYESGELAIAGGGANTLAHGLGGTPKLAQFFLRCKVADLGWSVGDELPVGTGYYTAASDTVRGLTASLGPLYVIFRIGVQSFSIINKSTGAIGTITNASWVLIVRAWA